MPVVGTKAAASAQGFGEFTTVSGPATYIEDVFSTYLYAGTSANQTITNGVDLSGKGGLVWIKARDLAANNVVFDSARGEGPTGNYAQLFTDSTAAQTADPNNGISSFNANGFSLTNNEVTTNRTGYNYVSWTFRKQPKFFDVVTYTGNGVAGRTIAHNLGSTPGCIIIKATNQAYDWGVYHRSSGFSNILYLNLTNAQSSNPYFVAAADSSTFTVGSSGLTSTYSNENGTTYVAYLFAHNAGGFGLTGTDNVISCGSYTGTGSGEGPQVNLGYEPQWLLIKNVTGGASMDWWLFDSMRGMTVFGGIDADLRPNSSQAEERAVSYVNPNATGFTTGGATALNQVQTYIYIAIRRGPMKTPTTGTSVFSPVSAIATSGTARTTGFPVDLQILAQKDKANYINTWAVDRLRGVSTTNSASGRYVFTNTTDAEATANAVTRDFGNTGYVDPGFFGSLSMIWWNFRRAPGFFDEVCYTGTGSARTVNHNLGVVPELIIVKKRNDIKDWVVYNASLGATKYLYLNLTDSAAVGAGMWDNTSPTASVFSTGAANWVNTLNDTYVAYLFASCPGVSKVGSYTGNGSSQTINCGFTGGARFVMIKRTDSTGNWWVWDTARGMTAGTDYRIPLNTTDAETNANWVYTNASGFQIVTTDATVNASGGSYIFLAIA